MNIRHGTITGYATDKCRCDACKLAQFRYDKRKVGRKQKGPLLVPSVGSARRVRALQAIGWPLSEICSRIGRRVERKGNLGPMLNRPTVTIGLHRRICAVYEELSMTPGPSNSARLRAVSAGYFPPLAWDDDKLDDPSAHPEVADDPEVPFLDLYAEMRAIGRSDTEIAQKFGLKPKSLEQRLARIEKAS